MDPRTRTGAIGASITEALLESLRERVDPQWKAVRMLLNAGQR